MLVDAKHYRELFIYLVQSILMSVSTTVYFNTKTWNFDDNFINFLLTIYNSCMNAQITFFKYGDYTFVAHSPLPYKQQIFSLKRRYSDDTK